MNMQDLPTPDLEAAAEEYELERAMEQKCLTAADCEELKRHKESEAAFHAKHSREDLLREGGGIDDQRFAIYQKHFTAMGFRAEYEQSQRRLDGLEQKMADDEEDLASQIWPDISQSESATKKEIIIALGGGVKKHNMELRAVKKEIRRLRDLEKRMIEKRKNKLIQINAMLGQDEIVSDRMRGFSIYRKKSPKIIVDERSQLPWEFMYKKIIYDPDMGLISNKYKEGKPVPGTHLEYSIVVK